MTPAERAAADLARITKGMPSHIAKVLLDGYAAESAKKDAAPRVALRMALAEFVKTHASDGKAWAKRDAAVDAPEPIRGVQSWNYNVLVGDIDGDGDTDFACKSCLKIQPACVCAACGEPGPGGACFACGRELAYSCPKCAAPWSPVLVEELEDAGGVRTLLAVVQETRTSAEQHEGFVRCVINSEEKDDWGTVIPPEQVAPCINPALVLVDIDHQICKHGRTSKKGCPEHDGPIEGARCSSVTVARVPWKAKPADKPKMVKAVIVDTVFNLRMPRAKLLYDGIEAGKYVGASILLTYPKTIDDDIKAGRTDTISKVCTVPAYTFSAAVSNPVAMVSEIRTSRLMGTKIHDEQEIIDPAKPAPEETDLADLKKAVDSIDAEAGTSPSPADAKVESPAPAAADDAAAGGAPEPSIADLSKKLSDISATVEQMRTAAPSKEWEPGLAALTARLDAVTAELEKSKATVEGQRTLIRDTVNLAASGYQKVNARLNRLTAPPARVGHSGADNAETTEALRTLRADDDARTKEQRAHDAHQREADRLSELAVGG